MRDEDYARLLDLRVRLRGFLEHSAERAAEAGLSPSQHQLLLAVRGHAEPEGPTISDVAGYLGLRHHSAVELAKRAEDGGFLRRTPDASDRRKVRLSLTRKGRARLERVASANAAELAALSGLFSALDRGLRDAARPPAPRRGARPS